MRIFTTEQGLSFGLSETRELKNIFGLSIEVLLWPVALHVCKGKCSKPYGDLAWVLVVLDKWPDAVGSRELPISIALARRYAEEVSANLQINLTQD